MPGSQGRWLAQQREREWHAGLRRCERCRRTYGGKAHRGVRFCSMDCFRAAQAEGTAYRPRPPREVVVPTHAEILEEMQAALAELREVSGL